MTTTTLYILCGSITSIVVLLGLCIKLWSDVQILKNWKIEHMDDHHIQQTSTEKTFTKIFDKIEEMGKEIGSEVKDLAASVNQLIGKIDEK